jgi:hypothetical protein
VKHLVDLAANARVFREELARSEVVARQLDAALARTARRAAERIELAPDPAARRAEVATQIRDLERTLDLRRRNVEAAKGEVREWESMWSSFTNFRLGVLQQLGEGRQMAQADLDREIGRMEKESERLAELRRMSRDLKDPSQSPEVVRGVNELTAALERQMKTFGMTANQIALYDLKAKGATDRQLARAREVQDTIEWQERQAKFEADQLERRNRLLEEGKALSEELRTPVERFADEAGRLRELFAGGAIGWTTLLRGFRDAAGRADEAARAPGERLSGLGDAVRGGFGGQLAGRFGAGGVDFAAAVKAQLKAAEAQAAAAEVIRQELPRLNERLERFLAFG